MSNLSRWNPYQEMANFRRAMGRMFDDPLFSQNFEWDQPALWEMPLDVIENQDGYVIKASLPGINPDDIDITYNTNTLTIRGDVKEDVEDEDKNQHYHLRERRFGTFSRSVYLPVPIDANKIEASYDSGTLRLVMPKTEEVKPKRIPVRGNSEEKTLEAKAKDKR